MSLYWKDITTPDIKWRGIEITVDNSQSKKTNFSIEACGKRFFSVKYCDQTLFWVRQHYTHHGAALIKNYQVSHDVPIVSHIRSSDIEKRKYLEGSKKFKSWSKYFIQSLNRIENHFFREGKWIITAFHFSFWQHLNDTYEVNKSSYDIRMYDALNTDIFQYISWWDTPYEDVEFIGLHTVDEDSGRLKWWRKKAKEGTLPPVLFYYISGLGSYILLDGHYRLKAAQLEDIRPDAILLTSYKTEKYDTDPKIQQAILKSLQHRKRNRSLNQDELNNILINAYTKEHIHINHTSEARSVPQESCLKDMMIYLDKINKIELAQRLFDETNGKGW